MASVALSSGARALLPALQAAAVKYSLTPAILAAIAWQESRFNPNAFNPEGDGSDPSRGLMQLRESTARGLGFTGPVAQLFSPQLSLELGARLLRQNINRVALASPTLPAEEMLARAVSAYNAGWSTKRPGDAPRSASGEFVNQSAYVAPVFNYRRELTPVLSPGTPPPAGFPASGGPDSGQPGSGLLFAMLAALGVGLVLWADSRRDAVPAARQIGKRNALEGKV